MGLFDQLGQDMLGQVLGGSGGDNKALVGAALNMMQSHQGGVSGLLNQFAKAGLENQVQSWLGTGANQAIGAGHVQQALGPDMISGLAKQLGMGHADVASGLANVLPQLVDKLSPQGNLPDDNTVGEGLGKLLGMLGK